MSSMAFGNGVLGDEDEHRPVSLAARRSTFAVLIVWLGLPMIITGAVMVADMGFKSALMAMLIGTGLMFAHVGAPGALGTPRGVNFALIASAVFGRKGNVLASGLLSTLLLGWCAVQTGITGNLIGAIILADLCDVRPGAAMAEDWRTRAFVAWAVGSLVACLVETFAPQLSTAITAITAFIAGGACYLLITPRVAAVVETPAAVALRKAA